MSFRSFDRESFPSGFVELVVILFKSVVVCEAACKDTHVGVSRGDRSKQNISGMLLLEVEMNRRRRSSVVLSCVGDGFRGGGMAVSRGQSNTRVSAKGVSG